MIEIKKMTGTKEENYALALKQVTSNDCWRTKSNCESK